MSETTPETGTDTAATQTVIDAVAAGSEAPVGETFAPVTPVAPDAPIALVTPGAEGAPAFPPAEFAAPAKVKRNPPWRWAGAVVVALAVGAGCAFGVMAPKRTDLPGLATAPDGRYVFAPLDLPSLAPGQADPTNTANLGAQHLSDIRKLLLPAPQNAVADHALPGATGWVSRSATLTLLGSPTDAQTFATDGWRHTAGVAWKTPDGAETKIYLMQFIDGSAASDASTALDAFGTVTDSTDTHGITAPGSTAVVYTVVKNGATNTWYGSAVVADTELLLVYTAPTSVGRAPFEQEADLQVELLQ
jgi:hypothetical protein